MSGLEFGLLLGLPILGLACVAWLVWRLRPQSDREELLRRLAELEAGLGGAFTRAQTDMAARVEQVKGDLRTDLADRLQSGLAGVRDTVDRQLAEGRAEQGRRLDATVTALEQKFDALRAGTETRLNQVGDRLAAKFDQLGETQTQSARQARGELAQALGETTKALEARFATLEQRTAQHLEAIRGNVDARLGAISEQVQAKLEKNIQEGFAHFQKVQEHLKAAEEQLRGVGQVGQSINELNNLLKLPHLRGKFGEAELGRLLADFLPASAFAEQEIIVPGTKEAVDAVVRFPNFRLPIDSKFNREQVLALFETGDPEALKVAREQLAVAIRAQARSISEKYIHPEHGTTDLALMFLPSETLYFEVIRNGGLCDALHKLKVFPVSPNTLAITLRAVAMSISQFEFAKGVEKTLEQLSAAQKSFGHFQRKFEDVGRGLEKAQEAYNTATGHLNRYTNRVVRLTGETVPELPEGTPEAPL
jgi:DNA recombination protein RmuC